MALVSVIAVCLSCGEKNTKDLTKYIFIFYQAGSQASGDRWQPNKTLLAMALSYKD